VKDNHKQDERASDMEIQSVKDETARNSSSLGDSTTADSNKAVLARIPQDLLLSIKEEALHKGISVNSVIVSVLKKYSGWWRFQERLGFMPLHKSMVIQMMDKIGDEDAEKIGRIQKDQTIKDFILFSESGYDLSTFIWWIKLRCEVLGFQFVVRNEKEDNIIFIMINHGMGSKWSHYYKGMFEAVLQELLEPRYYNEMKFSLTNSSFSVTITGMADLHETIIGKK